MKKQILLSVLLAAAGFVSLLLLSGCNPIELTGTAPVNIAPQILWADFPQDSLAYSYNPTLYWYSKDSDGQVMEYEYAVILADTVNAQGGPSDVADNIADSAWISLGNVTRARIPLFASPDTSVFVEQFVFVRCMDDKEAYSDAIYLFLSRNNHPPTCEVFLPPGPQWCLPETTNSWTGIPVSWDGKDSLDYPGIPPAFLWEVRIYGPFADSLSADTTGSYVPMVDLETGDLLTTAKSGIITDLVTGWYIVYVKNYDDAFVPSIPVLGSLEVYEPRWIRHSDYKEILLVDHNKLFSTPRYGELTVAFRDSLTDYYTALIEGAGYTGAQYDVFDANDDLTVVVDQSVLYDYKLVVVIDTDWNRKISTTQQDQYAKYLDVGGMLWVIGRRSFDDPSQLARIEYAGLPFNYMNLTGAYLNTPNARDSAEFRGATPLVAGFPELSVDTLKVSYTSWPLNHYAEALFGVGYIVLRPGSEPLYTFQALDPFTSRFHAFPVAARYDPGTYKTSYFSFPLYFIDQASAQTVTSNMLEWFLAGN